MLASCSVGTYFDGEQENCILCPNGTYQDNEGQIVCEPCPNLQRSGDSKAIGARSISECGGKDIMKHTVFGQKDLLLLLSFYIY